MSHLGHRPSNKTREKLRIARFKNIQKEHGINYPCIGKNETQILNKIEKKQKIKIMRQFYIKGYWLDGYCKETNTAYEIDENHHFKKGELSIRDKIKQQDIIDELHCNFIRIKV